MGTTYTATIEVACYKQHTCVSCNSSYAYVLQRKISGQSSSEAGARQNADQLAMKSMEKDVDFHACPSCGTVQPEMIADVQAKRFWAHVIIGVIGMALALILGVTQVMTISTSAFVAIATTGVVLMLFTRAAKYNPNADLDANRMESEGKVNSEVLVVTEKAEGRAGSMDEQVGGLRGSHFFALLVASVAVLAAATPILLTGVVGWSANDSCYPAVCGPGDAPCFYFPQKIKSIKGMWNGQVMAKAIPTEGGEEILLRGHTKSSSWDNVIEGESVDDTTNKMWATIDFPSDPSLAGKTLKLLIHVNAKYPFEAGAGFDETTKPFDHSTEITLSSPGAGSTYYTSWWAGQTACLGMIIFAGIILLSSCRILRASGNQTLVAPIGEDEAE